MAAETHPDGDLEAVEKGADAVYHSVAGLPMWKPYDDTYRCAMVFEAEPKVVCDYHPEARKILDDRDTALVRGV